MRSKKLDSKTQRIHSEETHECQVCGKKCPNKVYLREHIRKNMGKGLLIRLNVLSMGVRDCSEIITKGFIELMYFFI